MAIDLAFELLDRGFECKHDSYSFLHYKNNNNVSVCHVGGTEYCYAIYKDSRIISVFRKPESLLKALDFVLLKDYIKNLGFTSNQHNSSEWEKTTEILSTVTAILESKENHTEADVDSLCVSYRNK